MGEQGSNGPKSELGTFTSDTSHQISSGSIQGPTLQAQQPSLYPESFQTTAPNTILPQSTIPYPPQSQPPYLPAESVAPYPPQPYPVNTGETNPAYPPPPYPGLSAQHVGTPDGVNGTKKYPQANDSSDTGWQTPYQQHSGPPPTNVTIVRTTQVTHAGVEPESYLLVSILSVCCCLVFGIIAIVYSTQVGSLWSQGRHAESRRASNTARGWAIAAFVVGSIGIIFNVIRAVTFAW